MCSDECGKLLQELDDENKRLRESIIEHRAATMGRWSAYDPERADETHPMLVDVNEALWALLDGDGQDQP